MAEKDKLPLKNYAHCDSFDTVTFNYIIVLHGADTLVFVLYNTVHLNNNISIYINIYRADRVCVCVCVFAIRARVSCSVALKLAVVSGGIGGQVIAG